MGVKKSKVVVKLETLKMLVVGVASAAVTAIALMSALVFIPPPTPEAIAWEYACELSRYDCHGVKPPWIHVIQIAGHNARGASLGDRSIYIDPDWSDFTKSESMLVLIHEMVHYLQHEVGEHQTDGYIRSGLEACIVEGEAHTVSNQYAVLVGRVDLIKDWVSLFGCERREPEPEDEEEIVTDEDE